MKCLGTRRGQSMIELSFVALAVIAGIVLGGPYMLDSINSHFKIWDTAVSDSTNDRLVKANKEDLNIPDQACVPQGKAPGSCEDPRGNCKATERFYTHQYTPVGCRTNFSCEADDECCSIPQLTQLCWRKKDPQNSTRKWASADDIKTIAAKGFKSCYLNGVYNDTVSNCKNGDQLYQFSCGEKENMFVGLSNPDKCLPVCGPGVPLNSTACPNQGNPALMDDSQNRQIIPSATPCSAFEGACQAKCDEGTIFRNGQCLYVRCGDNEKNQTQEDCDGGQLCTTNCKCPINSHSDQTNGCVCNDPQMVIGYGAYKCPGRTCGYAPNRQIQLGCIDLRYNCDQCDTGAYLCSRDDGCCRSNVADVEQQCAPNSHSGFYWCKTWAYTCIPCPVTEAGCPGYVDPCSLPNPDCSCTNSCLSPGGR